MPLIDMPLEKLKTYMGSSPKPADFDEFWDRSLAEMLRLWMFHDERPLEASEVEKTIAECGVVLHKEIVWANFLTQQILVAQKRSRE